MNSGFCVAAGAKYTDIDALACAIAFAELKGCAAYLPGALNATVPASLRSRIPAFQTEFPEEAREFVIVDASNPEWFAKRIPLDKISLVFDHHFGFEEYWGSRGRIEPVGACATLIFELFEREGRAPSAAAADLLYTAIFANTLNFNASVTTERDRAAFAKLKPLVSFGEDWAERYYAEVESGMFSDVGRAIASDTKIASNGWAIAQLELYDARALLDKSGFMEAFFSCLGGYEKWLLTLPSIKEGGNCFISNSSAVRDILAEALGVVWTGDFGRSGKLYLRKEIMKIIGLR